MGVNLFQAETIQKRAFFVLILDYYLEGTRKIRTFALSMKNDEICGLPSQQKFPCARVNVSSGEPKTESIQRQVKIINNNLLIF